MTLLSSLFDDPEAFVAPLRVRAPGLVSLPRAVAGIGGEERERDVERTGPLQSRVADTIRAGQSATLSRRDLEEGRMRAVYMEALDSHRALSDDALAASLAAALARRPAHADWCRGRR